MNLIVGLGNPGDNYRLTKHNFGFWIVDKLVEQRSLKYKLGKGDYVFALDNDCMFLKPTSFMNNSGVAIKQALNYYKNIDSKLNKLSRSSAAQSTLVIDDNSSCKFTKIDQNWFVKKGLKIIKKESIFKKDYWKIVASHDGYLKKYNSLHEREIEFYPEKMMFIGRDKIIKKK